MGIRLSWLLSDREWTRAQRSPVSCSIVPIYPLGGVCVAVVNYGRWNIAYNALNVIDDKACFHCVLPPPASLWWGPALSALLWDTKKVPTEGGGVPLHRRTTKVAVKDPLRAFTTHSEKSASLSPKPLSPESQIVPDFQVRVVSATVTLTFLSVHQN